MTLKTNEKIKKDYKNISFYKKKEPMDFPAQEKSAFDIREYYLYISFHTASGL